MKRILIVAVIMAMLMSGCSMMMSTMEQGATQPTVEEMLAQALQLSNAGNYEEAILLYEAIIEIEPNNYEAGYGLGHAYRSVGRTMDAISILLSGNGARTELNDVPVSGAADIQEGDRIRLGGSTFDFVAYCKGEKRWE